MCGATKSLPVMHRGREGCGCRYSISLLDYKNKRQFLGTQPSERLLFHTVPSDKLLVSGPSPENHTAAPSQAGAKVALGILHKQSLPAVVPLRGEQTLAHVGLDPLEDLGELEHVLGIGRHPPLVERHKDAT
jgi:hypothetical protein